MLKFEKNDEKDINITEIEEKTNRQNPPIIASLSSHPSKLDIKSSVCRICLGDDNEADNPLLTPCKCAGTMKFIHILCLQKWLKSKLQMKQTEFYTSMIIKPLLCELCRTQFPGILININ